MEPQGFGSGCIIQYKERRFLLSVAHVTDIDGLATCICKYPVFPTAQ
jgi:hypothetical protein